MGGVIDDHLNVRAKLGGSSMAAGNFELLLNYGIMYSIIEMLIQIIE